MKKDKGKHTDCCKDATTSGCNCCSCHSNDHRNTSNRLRPYIAPAISFVMLIAGVLMSHFNFSPFTSAKWIEYIWYVSAFLPVGLPVIREALEGFAKRDYFNEFTLMVIASVGAFCIGELPEGVGVMLFYCIGETLQHEAVGKATRNISNLLDVRGEKAHLIQNNGSIEVDPKNVNVGELIEIYPGERVPLDGKIEGQGGLFDTSALTGESLPRELSNGDEVLAGMISSTHSVRIQVSRPYSDSALSRILDLVRNASSRKAHTELFIRRFARIYTPVVISLAALLVIIPAIVSVFSASFHFVPSEWIYRALVFLVISCPCALVVSVPLGYFAGIGAASKAGILFKGGNYLDALTGIDTIAFDKTGTLTTGKFNVDKVISTSLKRDELLSIMAAAESASTHPLARALVEYVRSENISIPVTDSVTEKPGFGVSASISNHNVLVGNPRLLHAEKVDVPEEMTTLGDTIILCAIDGLFAGYVTLADTLKPDARQAVDLLHSLGINHLVMLSGDRRPIVSDFAIRLGIAEAHGELLPQDKAKYVEEISQIPGRSIAFVGDGMNDAPVLALSDVGIAMGGLGSDAAIESADIVIQTDMPSRVATALKIARTTRTIVKENIVGAIGIKVLILALGALGYASLWAAVFADVGIALLAILNSMRILWKRY